MGYKSIYFIMLSNLLSLVWDDIWFLYKTPQRKHITGLAL